MLRGICLVTLLFVAAPAIAEPDEIKSVPADVLIGHSYFGETAASAIHFINVRRRAVSIVWIGFDGNEHFYAQLEPGEELLQPTFVAHRWLVKDAADGKPIAAFISTRSAAHGEGTAQIAVIH